MFKKIAVAAALVIASSSAFAGQPNTFYAGLDAGATKVDDFSGHGTGFGGFVGYNFVQNVAIEAGYRRLGRAEVYDYGTWSDVDVDQAAVSVVGTLPLGSNFSLLGRLGYNRIEAKGDRRTVSTSGGLVGLGLGYAFDPTISGRVELTRVATDATNLSVGIAFKF